MIWEDGSKIRRLPASIESCVQVSGKRSTDKGPKITIFLKVAKPQPLPKQWPRRLNSAYQLPTV